MTTMATRMPTVSTEKDGSPWQGENTGDRKEQTDPSERVASFEKPTTPIQKDLEKKDLDKEDLERGSAVETEDEEAHFLSGYKLFAILTPVLLAYFLLMLDTSIISTAIPQITTDFNSLADMGWYGSAYQLAGSVFQPLSGKVFASFKTKWTFVAYFLVFELGSALCGAAQSSGMLIAGRAFAGLGSAGLMIGALTIVAAILPPHKQAIVMGVCLSLGQLGLACGPLVGGALTEYVSWRWCFYINLPVGVMVGVLILLSNIPEPSPKPPIRDVLVTAVRSLDLLGFGIVVPAAVMFFMAIQWGGNQYAWNSSVIIGLFVGAAITFVLFLSWEYHQGDEAMIPFSMIRKRIVWSASAMMFFFLSVQIVSNYYLPVYFQAIRNDSALMSGVHILPYILSRILVTLLSGVSVEFFGYYLPWAAVGTALTAIGVGLLSLLNPSTAIHEWIGYQILMGLGCGMAITMPFIAIQNLFPAKQMSVAMAILIFCQNLGAAVFLITAESIFNNTMRQKIEEYAPGVNPDVIIDAGARSIRQLVSGDQLSGVVRAYSISFDHVMYLVIGISAMSFLFCWGLGWKDIRKKKKTG